MPYILSAWKMANAEEIIITDQLFRGIQPILEKHSIQWFQEKWAETSRVLKSLNATVAYRLIPPENADSGMPSTDLYRAKREELFETAKKIPFLQTSIRP